MDEKRKLKGWRKGIAVGCLALVVLLVLMAIGLTVGRRRGSEPVRPNEGLKQEVTGYSETAEQKDIASPEAATGQNSQAGQVSGARTQIQQAPKIEAKVIRTGAVSVEIKKGTFNDKYAKVQLIAEGAGGLISDSRSNSSNGSITGGTVTLRVPNDSFGKVMEQLRELGEVTAVTEQAQDVTEEYVDLESRIRNLKSQESVYLALMARATTIEEAISVQRELSVIQGQIEELTGRKNYLDNHVSYSTIQVTMTEPGASGGDTDEGWGFVDALKDALHGVVDGLNAVIIFLGNALIYILILALVGLGIYYLVKRRSKEKPEA